MIVVLSIARTVVTALVLALSGAGIALTGGASRVVRLQKFLTAEIERRGGTQ